MAKPKQTQSDDHFDFDSFQGFVNPTTTPTPDLLFDHIMQDLNESEIKVLLYIIRRTYGFKKNTDDISLNQLVDGICTKDGKVLDRGTGLSKSTVKRALQSLKEKNLIDATHNQDPQKGNLPTTYSLKMNSTPRPASGPRGGSPVGLPLAHQWAPQQTVKQQTDFVVKRLHELKISEEKANKLVYRYSDSYIEEKIELLEWKLACGTVGRPIKDPAAWLIKAIENDYKPPEDFKPLADLEKEKEEDRLKQEELELELRAEKNREKKYRDRIIEVYQIPDNLLDIWKKLLEGLKAEGSYEMLLSHLEGAFLVSIEKGIATVLVDDKDNQQWLNDRAKSILATRFTGVLGEQVRVRFEVL